MAATRNSKRWDGLCNPCKKTGIYASGSVFCHDCKQIYCANCSKLHKLHRVGSSHCLSPYIHEVETPIRSESVLDISTFRYDQFGKEETDQQKVKYEYIKALSADHDHVHQSYPDEIFCTSHKEVICLKCKFRRHSLCNCCIPIKRASQMLVESGQYLQLVTRIKKCHDIAGNALQVASSERKSLTENEGMILQQIQDLKMAIITHVSHLELELLEAINSSHGKAIRNLTKTVNTLQRIKKGSNEMLQLLKNNITDGIGESSLKSIIECHVKSILFFNMLGRVCDIYDLKNINECLFKSEYSKESISHCFGSLGTVSVNKFDSQLPLILLDNWNNHSVDVKTKAENEMTAVFNYKDKNCDDQVIRNIMERFSYKEKRITRWSNPCVIKIGVVSIVCVNSETLLALDRTTCSILLIDCFGDVVTNFKFRCMPWAMTLFDDNMVAVSVPGENKVYLVGLKEREFFVHKVIECEKEPSAVSGYEESIYVTSYPWSDKAAVHKLSVEGRVTATIETEPISGRRLFKAPLDICVDKVSEDIFVCDSGLKLVYVFNNGLLEKFRVDLEYMGHPSSMTLDTQGNAFVCGKLSNVIFKITTAKKRGKIVFTADHGLSRPQAITCIPEENSLCVFCARDNEFKLLKKK